MILVIVLSVLLLGIALFQAKQGLFSAMILLILTIMGAAIAFGYYETVGDMLAGRIGAYAYPASLLVLFVVPVIILRELFDWKMPGNVVLGQWPDRIGGAAFGLLTGFLMVGVLSIVLQMLPFPAAVLGYTPYNSELHEQDGWTPQWAANFTLGLVGQMSGGSFSAMSDSATGYETVHKDLLLESFGLRNRPSGGSTAAGDDAFHWTELYSLAEQEGSEKFKGDEAIRVRLTDDAPQYALLDKSHGSKLYVARVTVSEGTEDSDGWFRMPATHFRIVGSNGNLYYPVGYLTYVGGWRLNTEATPEKVAKVGDVVVARPKKTAKLTIDWLYRLSDNEKPEYMVFRNAVRVPAPNQVVAGLPVAADPKAGQLALGVKAASGSVTFTQTGKRFLQPESMAFLPALSTAMPAMSGELPPEMKEFKADNDRIRSVMVGGNLQAMVNRVGAGSNVRWISILYTPTKTAVLQVRFKIDPNVSSDYFKAHAAEIKPTILLGDGRLIGASGEMIQGTVGGEKQSYVVYDADKPTSPPTVIDPGAAEAMVKQAPNNPLYIFYFLVPTGSDVSVANIDLGLGRDYEFFADAPLAAQ